MIEGLNIYRSGQLSSLDNVETWRTYDHVHLLQFASHFFPMSRSERDMIDTALALTAENINVLPLIDIAREAEERAAEGLTRIKLTTLDYAHAVEYLITDQWGELYRMAHQADKAMNKQHIDPQWAMPTTDYDHQWQDRHRPLIETQLAIVPSQKNPWITMLVGPTGVGKSAWLMKDSYAHPYNAINCDIDQIQKMFTASFDPRDQKHIAESKIEAWRYADTLSRAGIQQKKPLTFQTSLWRIDAWMNNPILYDAVNRYGYSMRMIVINRPSYDSLRRMVLRGTKRGSDGRMVALSDLLASLKGYNNVIPVAMKYGASILLKDYSWLINNDLGHIAYNDFVRMTDYVNLLERTNLDVHISFEEDEVEIEKEAE